MIKVFMEYRIKEENIGSYQAAMREVKEYMIKQNVMNYHHFEGVDQPFIFVEMYDVETISEYERLKELRCEKEPFFAEFVSGGRGKIHMWAFRETTYAE